MIIISKKEKYILAVHFGFHDSNICIASSEEILLHLEAERIFRERKHMALESKQAMENLIKIGLDYLSLTIEDIETVYISRIENYFGEKNVKILGKKFNPIIGHHNNHIGTSLPSNFEDALIVCADGGSEVGTTKIYHKKNGKIEILEDLDDTPMNGRFYGPITKKLAPAIVHVDGTSRVQILEQKVNPVLHSVLLKIGKKTGAPILMKTSLNVMGEPIVDTPEDALRNFYNCDADVLYINGKRYIKEQ